MAATAKQLAALKKGREARKKKLAASKKKARVSTAKKAVKKKIVKKVKKVVRKKNPVGVISKFAVCIKKGGKTAYLSKLKPIRFNDEKSSALELNQANALAWRGLLDKKYGNYFSVVRLKKK